MPPMPTRPPLPPRPMPPPLTQIPQQHESAANLERKREGGSSRVAWVKWTGMVGVKRSWRVVSLSQVRTNVLPMVGALATMDPPIESLQTIQAHHFGKMLALVCESTGTAVVSFKSISETRSPVHRRSPSTSPSLSQRCCVPSCDRPINRLYGPTEQGSERVSRLPLSELCRA